MKRVIFIIDGEYMRRRIISTKPFYYNGESIRNYCLASLNEGEELSRIYFYDSTAFNGTGEHPLSGPVDFSKTSLTARKNEFLKTLKNTPDLTLRLGRSSWDYTWSLNYVRLGELLAGEISANDISESDVLPNFKQTGIDVQIGLDIAKIALKHQADRIVFIANDNDYIPCVELAKDEGIKVTLDTLGSKSCIELREVVDNCHTLLKDDECDPIKIVRNVDIENWVQKMYSRS